MERIEIEHNKKITVLFSFLYFCGVGGLVACIVLAAVKFDVVSGRIGSGFTIAVMVLIALCAAVFCLLFLGQIVKLRRKIIFVADENGICDYSRHIVLAPIAYREIESIEYKEFFSDDMSDWQHLKINLKDKRAYMKRLNLLQKIDYVLCLREIELHLFCAKTKIKNFAERLKQNLALYRQTNS